MFKNYVHVSQGGNTAREEFTRGCDHNTRESK